MLATAQLSRRSLRILAALVREYIESGEPVGSRAIVAAGGVDCSPATVRAELARLEDLGYVHQPHTSAGRVPSDLGYRVYVDLLLQNRPARRRAPALEADLRERAGGGALMDDVLSYVSHFVSQASHHLGFALGPHHHEAAFHQIDFVPLAGTAILAVVVTRGGQVSHRVVDLGHRVPPAQLAESARFLSQAFAGLRLATLRAHLATGLAEGEASSDPQLLRSLRLAGAAFDDLAPDQPFYIEGAASLLDESAALGGVSIGTIRALLQMLEAKRPLVRLLSMCLESSGVTVAIGREHGTPDLSDVAIVASTYSDGRSTGGIGIIGPVRMHYGRAISLVDSVAQAVSRVLKDSGWSAGGAAGC